jgi:YD repeat-containing protein
MLFSVLVYSQDFEPMKSPDVTAFMNSNYFPINETTGKAVINIPIYTVNLDGMKIPISLTYDSGGVKVNSSSSSVGLNWNLNAGGNIIKEVRDKEDVKIKVLSSSLSDAVYIGYGYLMHLFPVLPHSIVEGLRDKQPDIYYVEAPNLSTQFVHKKNGKALELNKSNNIIRSPFDPTSNNTFINLGTSFINKNLKDKIRFSITSNLGFVYEFNDTEYSAVFPRSRSLHCSTNNFGCLTDDLVSPKWPLDYSEENIQKRLYGPALYGDFAKWRGSSVTYFSSIHLTKITNPVSKKFVQYYFDDNFIVDNNRRIEREMSKVEGLISQVNFEHDYNKEKVLKKIVFPDGVVDFYYESNRLDVRGGKILKKITVINNYGELLKTVVFNQDYFTSVENCTDNHCYRLRLNSITFLDKDNNVLPGYTFEYNTTKLPKRFSVNQDFTGYYNGQSGISNTMYSPKVYFKENQGKHSYIPFQFPGYTLEYGNANKNPNLTYSKSASLEKITYPTGGYTRFNYELNSFSFLNTSVATGGLRLQSQSMYNSNDQQIKRISYNYNGYNGISSGGINKFPRYNKPLSYNSSYTIPNYSQINNTKLELSNGTFISYEQVKSMELNNGVIINEYTGVNDFPNETPTVPTSNYNIPDWLTFNINNGLSPIIFEDFSSKRGKLISSKTYNNNNTLLKSIENYYEYKVYESIQIEESVLLGKYGSIRGDLSTSVPHASFSTNNNSESTLLKKSLTTEYTDSGELTNEKVNVFNETNPFLRESQVKINNTETKKEVIYYPFDSEVSDLPFMEDLTNLNIITPIKKEYFSNDELLAINLTTYQDFDANKILPSKVSVSKGIHDLEVKSNFNKYDKRGNIIEYKKEDDITISILWGYDYQYKIAEILNADYDAVLAALNVNDIKYLQTKTNSQLETELSNLRNNLPNAHVHSYIHTPGVGVLSITDPRGRKNSYEYDSFKRLISIKDHDGKVLTKNTYNYKLNPAVSIPDSKPLNVAIKKSATPDYVANPGSSIQYTLLYAMTSGGSADYNYEWRENGSSTILSNSYKYIAEVSCNNNKTYAVTVTDLNGASLTKTVTVNAPICGETFYLSEIYGGSRTNNQNNFWVDPAEGLSFGKYLYTWFVPGPNNFNGPSIVSSYTNLWPAGSNFLKNNTGSPITTNLSLRVTDVKTGYQVLRSRTVTIQHEFVIPGCFIEGTSITMFDGSLKNIENIKIGDKVLSYNLESKKTEVSIVEELESPIHKSLVKLNFEKEVENTNTLDHPYYVKDKGWASYDPKATKHKYGIDVKKMRVGDTVLLYMKGEKMQEIKLLKEKFIDQAHQTYNLSKVSKNHNFFANGVLVHNRSSFTNSNPKN